MTYYYRLQDLPMPYQAMFQSGQIPANSAFYPFAHRNGSFGALVLLVAVPLFIILPLVMLYALLGIVINPMARTGLEELLIAPSNPIVWFLLVGVFFINGLGSLVLLVIGSKMVKTFWLGWQAAKAEQQGHFYYGMLLDEENLVCRMNRVLGEADCLLLPKKLILQAEVLPRPGYGRESKDCLIRLEDARQLEQTIKLDWQDFELPPYKELVGVINAWRKMK